MAGRTTKGELTGNLTPLAQKRILKERQKLEQDRKELEDCGIFTQWGNEVHKSIAMIIGPEGTPYARGFYFFDIQIPDNYPMHPPHVDFKTGDGRVRFNPNLYVEGKVCLSILGTWSGPSWTTSCNLRTVLVSIQSLLNDHPIQNEPGHEKENGKDDKAYSEIIRYENIAVGVIRMLKHTPAKFSAFRPQMRSIFLQHIEEYQKTLAEYDAKEGRNARSPIWNFPVRYKPRELKKELEELLVVLRKEQDEADKAEQASGPAAVAGSSASSDSAAGSGKRPAEEGGAVDAAKRPCSAAGP